MARKGWANMLCIEHPEFSIGQRGRGHTCRGNRGHKDFVRDFLRNGGWAEKLMGSRRGEAGGVCGGLRNGMRRSLPRLNTNTAFAIDKRYTAAEPIIDVS